MRMKPKTARRLLLLAAVVVVAGGAAVAVLFVRGWQKGRMAADLKRQGLEFFQKQDYPRTMATLGTYLKRRRNDPEALLAYTRAREEIETADGAHVRDAIGLYREYLGAVPGDRDTAMRLLRLYNFVGFYLEARDLAVKLRPADLAAATVADLPTLKEETRAKIGLKTFDDSMIPLLDCMRRVAPDDFDVNLAYVAWFREAGRGPDALEFANKRYEEHPGDPQFRFLAAVTRMGAAARGGAAALASASTAANDYLRELCSIAGLDAETGDRRDVPGFTDPDFIARLAAAFDADPLRRHGYALAVFDDAATRVDNEELRRLFVRRAWQAGRAGDIVDRLATLKPDASSELFAFKALALIDLGRKADAAALAATLKDRQSDFRAAAWAPVIQTLATMTGSADAESLRIVRASLKEAPSEPVLAYFLGAFLADLQRSDEAREVWMTAASSSLAIGWPLPFVRISQSFLAEGRVDEAFDAAAAGLRVAPASLAGNAALLAAQVARIEAGQASPRDSAKLLGQIDELDAKLAAMPEFAARHAMQARLLPGRVLMRVRAEQRDEAVGLVRAALQADPPLPLDTLQKLAFISAGANLGLDDECLAVADRIAPAGSASLVTLTRALLLHASGKTADGLALLDSRTAAAAPTEVRSWRLARARFLDSTSDPRALANWKALVADYPDSIEVQVPALNSQAAATDLSFIDSILPRINRLTGGDDVRPSVTARLARARALIAGPATVRSRDEVVAILRGLVTQDPRLFEATALLCRALLLENAEVGLNPDFAGAAEQLRSAVDLAPHGPGFRLQLAQVLRRSGDAQSARLELERVASSLDFGLDSRLLAVERLIANGDGSAALPLLRTISESATGDDKVTAALLTARALAAARRTQDALAVYSQLADGPLRNEEQVFVVADALASAGERQAADRLLARLDSMTLSPGRREITLARFADRRGDNETARTLLRQACQAAPTSAEPWLRLARLHAADQQLDAAQSVVQEGLTSLPGNADLLVLQQQIQLSRHDDGSASLGALADALDQSPATRSRARSLRAVEELRVAGRLSDPKALLGLADRFPTDSGVQSFVVRRLLQCTPPRPRDTNEVARRARRALPDDIDLASTCNAAFRATGAWSDALEAATAMARLAPSADADTAVAEALLASGQSKAAIDLLGPLVQTPALDLADAATIRRIDLYARALAVGQSSRSALVFLAALLTKSPEIRSKVCLPIAGGILEPADAASLVEQVAAAADPGSSSEQLAIASAWTALALRFPESKDDFLRRSVAILRPLAMAADATAGVLDAYGTARWAGGDLTGAIETFRSAVDRSPSPALLVRLSEAILESGGSIDEALAFARRAAELPGGRTVSTLLALGRASEATGARHGSEGKAAERDTAIRTAIDAYRDACEADPGNLGAGIALAAAHESILDFPACISIYEKMLTSGLISQTRDRAAIQNNLAYALLKGGGSRASLDRARSLVLEAIAVNENASFFDTLGAVEAARGVRTEAIAAFRKACELDRQAAAPAIELAHLLLSSGDESERDEARRVLDALTNDPALRSRLTSAQQKRLDDARESLRGR